MTIATAACYAERNYAGGETTFSPGFSASDAGHVVVGYFNGTGQTVELIQNRDFRSPSTSRVP